VLSVGKLVLGQQRYYEQQVANGADDYYTGRGEAAGEWTGAGASELGLTGRVGADQFTALLEGSDPRAPEVRLRAGVSDPEVAALDLTFSAPKSVSVLFAVAPPEVAGGLVDCHERAVRAAVGWLEAEAVFVRRGQGGRRFEHGEGLVAAAYRHRMSRALDPQLHTHVVAANLARGSDGRFTALHHPSLYRAAKTAGYLYQAQLRAAVGEELGLEWGVVRNGAAELAGVSAGVLAEFSKRRREMLRAAGEGGIGLGSKAAAEKAALATRDRKQYGIDTHSWREEVRARAGELGFDRDTIERLLDNGRDRIVNGALRDRVDELALGDRLAGSGGLTERANTFSGREVLREFAAAAGQGAAVEEVRAQAARFIARADVLMTARGELTTTELVACERQLVTAAIARVDDGVGVLDTRAVDRVISAGPSLTAEQANVVRTLAGSGRGVEVVEALAGAGKTYTAGVLREVYEDAGYQVLGVPPTGRAARELRDQAGIPARTLDRLLWDIEQLGDALPTGCVVVFDEAGMAATRTSARLLEHAERVGAKVIAIGDPGQLASVQAGGWLRAVGDRVERLRLTEVMRQRDPGERRALAALHARIPGRYLDWAQRARRIDTFDTTVAARERAVAEWADAVAVVGVEQAVMIARENDTRAALNHAARDLRRDQGLLGDECSYGRRDLAVGDRVICRRNDALLDVDNGTRGTVRHLDPNRVVLETDSRLIRELPAAYVAEHVEHAYALTGHGMQGATVEAAVVLASPRDLTAGWSYTALSRARDTTRLLIHDDQPAHDRAEVAPERTRAPATERELLAKVAARMLERDDEDLAIEQLTPAGRTDDHQLTLTQANPQELIQEQPAALAEPAILHASGSRLRELTARLDQLGAQRAALPIERLLELTDAHARTLGLTATRDELQAELDRLPGPSRGLLGRKRDPYLIDRTRLTSAITAAEHTIATARERELDLHARLGNPEQIRSELAGLDHAINETRSERDGVLDALTDHELQAPAKWATTLLGEQPTGTRGEDWDQALRHVARYRIEHDITDATNPLGPEPANQHAMIEWQQAHELVERANPGRALSLDDDLQLGR
jgi:conjugative relaxase-like TrwC/TraI family protein